MTTEYKKEFRQMQVFRN